jgi:hypothetical protein
MLTEPYSRRKDMVRKGTIQFRCWYCNRTHAASWDQVGQQRVCNCGERYRIPRREGIARRSKSVFDRSLEFLIYGLGGGVLGLLFGLLLGSLGGLILAPALAAVGFLVGGLFGERGINWIGALLRATEEDDHSPDADFD